jgi:hypothetical protein
MKFAFYIVFSLCLLSAFGAAQAINAPQYQVDLNFLTGGPYGQSQALDVAFGEQFTTNNRLQGDFITMPGPSYTGYFGGDTWNLTPLCPILSSTALSCGKFMPFITGEAGLGRVSPDHAPTVQGFAVLGEIGAGYDPTGAGKYTLLFKGGYGHFGPTYVIGRTHESGNGFFFYSGISFGGGSNASATQAKIDRIRQAEAKKLKELREKAAKQEARAKA